jgi:hypothetical protein
MTSNKYAKYILTEPGKEYLASLKGKTPKMIEDQRKAGRYYEGRYMFHLDDNILPGGFYTDCHWITAVKGEGGVQTEVAHSHDFPETLGFVGSNTKDLHALGGEIELWLEDERYVITQSCLIFVPAGMKHLPLTFLRIDTPVFFWTASSSTKYSSTIH